MAQEKARSLTYLPNDLNKIWIRDNLVIFTLFCKSFAISRRTNWLECWAKISLQEGCKERGKRHAECRKKDLLENDGVSEEQTKQNGQNKRAERDRDRLTNRKRKKKWRERKSRGHTGKRDWEKETEGWRWKNLFETFVTESVKSPPVKYRQLIMEKWGPQRLSFK